MCSESARSLMDKEFECLLGELSEMLGPQEKGEIPNLTESSDKEFQELLIEIFGTSDLTEGVVNKDRRFQDILNEIFGTPDLIESEREVVGGVNNDSEIQNLLNELNMYNEMSVEGVFGLNEIVKESKMIVLVGVKEIECPEEWWTLKTDEKIKLLGKVRKGFKKHGVDGVLYIKKKFYFISGGIKLKVVSCFNN